MCQAQKLKTPLKHFVYLLKCPGKMIGVYIPAGTDFSKIIFHSKPIVSEPLILGSIQIVLG